MTDFLDEKRKEIQARMKELKPQVDEYRRLEAAEPALLGACVLRAADLAARTVSRETLAGRASGCGGSPGASRLGPFHVKRSPRVRHPRFRACPKGVR
jgi:hypothetical protein